MGHRKVIWPLLHILGTPLAPAWVEHCHLVLVSTCLYNICSITLKIQMFPMVIPSDLKSGIFRKANRAFLNTLCLWATWLEPDEAEGEVAVTVGPCFAGHTTLPPFSGHAQCQKVRVCLRSALLGHSVGLFAMHMPNTCFVGGASSSSSISLPCCSSNYFFLM